MRLIDENASHKDIIDSINILILAHNALASIVTTLSVGQRFDNLVKEIDRIEKKITDQGDSIVSLVDKFDKADSE